MSHATYGAVAALIIALNAACFVCMAVCAGYRAGQRPRPWGLLSAFALTACLNLVSITALLYTVTR